MPVRSRYVRVASFAELYVEWKRSANDNASEPWFDVVLDGGELHVWIGSLKIEANKLLAS